MGIGLEYTFSQEDIQTAARYLKRCLTSLIMRKLQTETTMRYPLTVVRMALIKRKRTNVRKDVEKLELLYPVRGKKWYSTVENSRKIPQNIPTVGYLII